MAIASTSNPTVYQAPQQPKDYGKPNTNPAYNVNISANNPGVPPTVTPATKAGVPKPITSFNKPPSEAAAATPPPNPYGYASGPGILENWFNQRANGTDPGYEYAMKRGGDAIDNRMAAAGAFNSGARGQQLSDFAANMGAQREGQLDALAAGASGEYQGRLNSMFGQGLGLAGGESGINSAYDLAAGGAMSNALSALLGYTTNKAGVDSQSNAQGIGNVTKLIAAI